MKISISIIFLFIFCNGFGQAIQITGRIVASKEFYNKMEFASLILKQNNKDINGATIDVKGQFTIQNVKPGAYILSLNKVGYQDRFLDSITFTHDTIIQLSVVYPQACEYVYVYNIKPACINGHTDHIVKIVYGLPGKKLLKKAKKGKIWLAGCVKYDCSPEYYCTIHKRAV